MKINKEYVQLLRAQVYINAHEKIEVPPPVLETYIRDTLAKQLAEKILSEDLVEIKSYEDDEGGVKFVTTLKVIQE